VASPRLRLWVAEFCKFWKTFWGKGSSASGEIAKPTQPISYRRWRRGKAQGPPIPWRLFSSSSTFPSSAGVVLTLRCSLGITHAMLLTFRSYVVLLTSTTGQTTSFAPPLVRETSRHRAAFGSLTLLKLRTISLAVQTPSSIFWTSTNVFSSPKPFARDTLYTSSRISISLAPKYPPLFNFVSLVLPN
jgi:hypothetical protein